MLSRMLNSNVGHLPLGRYRISVNIDRYGFLPDGKCAVFHVNNSKEKVVSAPVL